MKLKFFKFTEKFMEREEKSLLLFFPELNIENTYEVLQTEYLTGEDDTYGVIKIKCVETKEVFGIDEIHRIPENERPNVPYNPWCFVYSDYTDEYEIVDGINRD